MYIFAYLCMFCLSLYLCISLHIYACIVYLCIMHVYACIVYLCIYAYLCMYLYICIYCCLLGEFFVHVFVYNYVRLHASVAERLYVFPTFSLGLLNSPPSSWWSIRKTLQWLHIPLQCRSPKHSLDMPSSTACCLILEFIRLSLMHVKYCTSLRVGARKV